MSLVGLSAKVIEGNPSCQHFLRKQNRLIAFHPKIQDLDRGGLVDDGLLFFRVATDLPQLVRGSGRGQRLIHEDQWKGRKTLTDLLSEIANLGGGTPLAAVHAKRQAYDEGLNFPHFRQKTDPLDRITLGDVDGLNWMAKDAEVVGSGDTDAGIAMIDAKRRMRGS
jgi:hypothetical protein